MKSTCDLSFWLLCLVHSRFNFLFNLNFRSEKSSTDGHHRENRNDFVEHANRENRDRDGDDRQKHRDKERLKDRERSKKDSSLNSSQSHQYRSSHDHRVPSTNNPPRNHDGPSADRWRSSSSR